MEPWLDSLSEDWNSEPRSSSPSSAPVSKTAHSRRESSSTSQSRIPHLTNHMRNSSNGSFLRPRSSRGIARQKENNALTERSAASLNAAPSSPADSAKRRTSTAIPRRASSSLSDSQTSVQHHSIHKGSKVEDGTPEWKRRLKENEDPTSDGFDLFSPTKLEGMFKQSSCPVEIENDENDESVVASGKKPWNSLNTAAFPPPSENFRSYRTSKNRPEDMATLEEVDEETDKSFDLSAISSEIMRQGSIKGIVRRRVSNLESADAMRARMQGNSWRAGQDPRMRTISGRKEISDEVFSPVEDAEKSSIRKQALQESLESDAIELTRNRKPSSRRSRSLSSDHDVSYDAQALNEKDESTLPEEPVVELTSLSLPEDLSMGTQHYNGNSILEASKRQTSGSIVSVIRRKLSSAANNSQLSGHKNFRSSPPPYRHNDVEQSRMSISEPTSPVDTSVVHHAQTPTQHNSAGSPLKLFGMRDTYTNNKLMRVLNQFEDDQSDQSELHVPEKKSASRMSNFGLGELDGFGFDKDVERPAFERDTPDEAAEKLFRDLPSHDNKHSAGGDGKKGSSPTKERSPKRRRTLLKDEIFVEGTEVEIKISTIPDNALAGKKRRDALPGRDAEPASPETLASRPIRRPSGSRKSSSTGRDRAASISETLQNATNSTPELAEQLAAELESFAKAAVEVKHDSRKPSLATKDYMEEANKVMEFIRARGKPKPVLPDIQEPEELSELDPDAILDLEVDDESTKDSFTRPPSREGRVLSKPDRRHAQHDPAIADHLNRFRDAEDLELLASASAFGTLQLTDNRAVEEAALIPMPEDEEPDIEDTFQSDPPGMRILNENDRKRKHTASEDGAHNSHSSDNTQSDGSRRTIMTTSSSGSGPRGMISQGTVSIPDTVGVMTFDREKKMWVKQKLKTRKIPTSSITPESKIGRQEVSEADPFDDIPDLSFDEQKEASWKKSPIAGPSERTAKSTDHQNSEADHGGRDQPHPMTPKPTTLAKSSLKSPRRRRQSEGEEETRPQSKGSQASQHEERLHNGLPSQDTDPARKQQPRVVTIAFSSPIASEIPYVQPPSVSDADIDQDDPSLLPLDDEGSVLGSSPAKPSEQLEEDHDAAPPRTLMGSLERHEQYRAMTLNRRPVSRIEEYDEEQEDHRELSLIHIKHNEVTPLPTRQMTVTRSSSKRESSILCLTPLSEFTVHQIDKLNHPEESFVAERANPKALRQAHGSAALVEDALVKAITDAEPSELFWEQLRRLTLQHGGLATLHGLKDYCSSLECLNITGNRVAQLVDAPISLRSLDISSNLVNDLTSWTHLHNLQTVNVSGNQLTSLECFSGLIHLRHLNASNNKVRNIEGILDLNGLITLDLSGNDLPEVDFDTCELVSLEKLDLSRNSLMHIRNLELLPRLRVIDLTDNLLEDITVKKGRIVPQLETLCLAHNELHEIDLTGFPNLKRLNIDDNMIAEMQGLAEAEHLMVLSARDQRVISNLVNTILGTAHDCSELYLSSNVLPEMGLTLPDTPNFTLRCLELASCGVQDLPQGFGDVFPNIRVLNLNFNALSDLSPLQGSVKLKQLFLAKNRIRKMRRTCLTISRLPAVRKVDLRENPLTVGFYAPMNDRKDSGTPYTLADRDGEQDKKWLGLMDEMTWLRRRAMELLMAQCCPGVQEADGGKFERDLLLREQATWQKLMGKGVLREKQVGSVLAEIEFQ